MVTQVIARIADTFFFEINSFTYTNTTYDLTVSASGHVETCTCPDRTFRPNRQGGCKHMKALQAELNARKATEKRTQNERIQAQAQAIVAKRFAELEKQRTDARANGGFSLLK